MISTWNSAGRYHTLKQNRKSSESADSLQTETSQMAVSDAGSPMLRKDKIEPTLE